MLPGIFTHWEELYPTGYSMCKKYDYLLLGAGRYSVVFAHLATKAGMNYLVIENRDHIGANIYCEKETVR